MPRDDRDAIEMLDRCHRQLEQRLAAMAEAAEVLGSGGAADDSTIEELREQHARFEKSARRHVADEEESVFPRLSEGRHVVETLQAEHERHAVLQEKLAALVARVNVPCPPELAAELRATIEHLRADYASHIELEDRELVPRVQSELAPAVLNEVLAEMKARRGKGA